MENYQKARVKVTKTQLNKLKHAAKSKTAIILRLNKKTLNMKNCCINYF